MAGPAKVLLMSTVLLWLVLRGYGGRVEEADDREEGRFRDLTSDQFEHHPGFKGDLSRIPRGANKVCGSTMTTNSGFVHSPGFPDLYEPDLLCTWVIQVQSQKQILLRFVIFDVRGGARGKCTAGEDYVMIRSDESSGQTLGIFCSPTPNTPVPGSILSKTNRVVVIFHTNGRQSAKGFLISYLDVQKVDISDYITQQVAFDEPTLSAQTQEQRRVTRPVVSTAAGSMAPSQSRFLPALSPSDGTVSANPSGQRVSPDSSGLASLAFDLLPVSVHFSSPEDTPITPGDVPSPEETSPGLTSQELTGNALASVVPLDDDVLPTGQNAATPTGHWSLHPSGQQTNSLTAQQVSVFQQFETSSKTQPFTKNPSSVSLQSEKSFTEQHMTETGNPPELVTQPLETPNKLQSPSQPVEEKYQITQQDQHTYAQSGLPSETMTQGSKSTPSQRRLTSQAQARTQEPERQTEQQQDASHSDHKQVTQLSETPSEVGSSSPPEQTRHLVTQLQLSQHPPVPTQQPVTRPMEQSVRSTQFVAPENHSTTVAHQSELKTNAAQKEIQGVTEAGQDSKMTQKLETPVRQFLTSSSEGKSTVDAKGDPDSQQLTQRPDKFRTETGQGESPGVVKATSTSSEIPLTPRLAVTSPSTGACGGSLHTCMGSIESPDIAADSTAGITCEWDITVPTDRVIVLYFRDIDLDSMPIDNWCSDRYDHIKVTDGQAEKEMIYCGNEPPPVFISAGSSLKISFVNLYGYSAGFRAVYTCRVSADEGKRLAEAANATQEDQAVTESDQESEIFTQLFETSSKQQSPSPNEATSKSLTSPSSGACGGSLHTCNGSIESPDIAGDSTAGITCEWDITVPTDRVIVLYFRDIDLDSMPIDNWCSDGYDHIKVTDGQAEKEMIYCGNEPPPVFISAGSSLKISFVNLYGYSEGFQAVYTCVSADEGRRLAEAANVTKEDQTVTESDLKSEIFTQLFETSIKQQSPSPNEATSKSLTSPSSGACGGSLHTCMGSIESPDIAGDSTAGTVTCEWDITVPTDRVIVLYFRDIDLDSMPIDNWCSDRYDHIKVTDGQAEKTMIYCGNEPPPVFISASSSLKISFMNLYGYSKGFHATYTCVSADEGRMLAEAENVTQEDQAVTESEQKSGIFTQPFEASSKKESPSPSELTPTSVTEPHQDLDGRTEGPTDIAKQFQSHTTATRQENATDFDQDARGFPSQTEAWDFSGNLHNPSGELESPNYPEAYPVGVRYQWNITVSSRGIIALTFTHFDLDSYSSEDGRCDVRYAHVKVLDESNQESHVFCGQEMPPALVSTSNTLIVSFISGYGYGSGFHAQYTMQKIEDRRVAPDSSSLQPVCGGTYYQPSGELSSPNFPEGLAMGVSCFWNITANVGQTILISFTDFSLGHENCSDESAYVRILDGNGGREFTYCGQKGPAVFTSTGNTALISFVSPGAFRGGFQALFWTSQTGLTLTSTPAEVPATSSLAMTSPSSPTCGGSLHTCMGSIESPDIAGDSTAGTITCEWDITVPTDRVIVLFFRDIDLDSMPIDNWCSDRYDHIKVTDGQAEKEMIYCGNEPPPVFISAGSSLKISFVNLYGYSKGFHAMYTCVSADEGRRLAEAANVTQEDQAVTESDQISEMFTQLFETSSKQQSPSPSEATSKSLTSPSSGACGGSLHTCSGSIESPDIAGDSTAGTITCEWDITVPTDRVIVLYFRDIDLDSMPIDNWCSDRYDHIKVTDGQAEKTMIYCGNEPPSVFVSAGSSLSISFMNLYGYSKGFHATYTCVSDDEGRMLAEPDGLTTPHQQATSQASSLCGGNLSRPQGFIQSPSDSLAMDCRWNITVGPGFLIVLNFTSFDLDSYPVGGLCDERYPHLKVADGNSSRYVFCGQDRPPVLVSTTRTLILDYFRAYGIGSRFRASYFSVGRSRGHVSEDVTLPTSREPPSDKVNPEEQALQCGGFLSAASGEIKMPGEWRERPRHFRCDWHITVDSHLVILFNFSRFHLDVVHSDSGRCDERFDHVRVVDGDANDPSSVHLFCSSQSPGVLVSATNTLIISFVSYFGYGDGFAAHYEAIQPERLDLPSQPPSTVGGAETSPTPAVIPYHCGGNLDSSEGDIQAPSVSVAFVSGITCTWSITVDSGSKITLSFKAFDLDSMQIGSSCDRRYAHVSVTDGAESATSQTVVFCGSEIPADFLSHTNSLRIAYVSAYGHGGEFSAHYSSSDADGDEDPIDQKVLELSTDKTSSEQALTKFSCGGIVKEPTGMIQSPNLEDSSQISNFNCRWTIRVDTGMVISLEFTYFDLDSMLIANACDDRYPHVKVFDGDSETSPAQTFCGQDVPSPFVSASNILVVTFQDGYGYSRGFRAEFSTMSPPSPATTDIDQRLLTAGKPESLPSCGRDFSGLSGTFCTPGYPELYPADVFCSWEISSTNSSHVITLRFLDFDLDSPAVHGNCPVQYSYVKIRSDDYSLSSESRLLCGSLLPETIDVSAEHITVEFHSNMGIGRGFLAAYLVHDPSRNTTDDKDWPSFRQAPEVEATPSSQTLNPSIDEGHSVLTAQSGTIESPNYPNQFPLESRITWIVQPSKEKFIHLAFVDVDFDVMTDDDAACSALYTHVLLTLYDIDGKSSEESICQNSTIPSFSYGQLKVEFRSSYGMGRGFKAHYYTGIRYLGKGSARPHSTTLTSSFSIPPTVSEAVAPEEKSLSPWCQYILVESRGQFSSPNYPSSYPANTACQWTVVAPPEQHVHLEFHHFQLDSVDATPCDQQQSHITIRASSTNGDDDEKVFCGKVIPPSVTSQSNSLVVTFSSRAQTDIGFLAGYQFIDEDTYQSSRPDTEEDTFLTTKVTHDETSSSPQAEKATVGLDGAPPTDRACHKVITDSEGVISSPNFPSAMLPGERCSWSLLVPGDQGLNLTFLNFALEGEGAADICNDASAFVSIAMAGDTHKFCGNALPPPMQSAENTVQVTFDSASGGGTGFRLQYADASPASHNTSQRPESGGQGVVAPSLTALNASAPSTDQAGGDFRFLGEDGEDVTGLPDDERDNVVRPTRKRVNLQASPQPKEPHAATAQPESEREETRTSKMTAEDIDSRTSPGHLETSHPQKTDGEAFDGISMRQLKITTYICIGVAVFLLILLVLLTAVCICQRRRQHVSKSIDMGRSEKSYWQNYKAWAKDYTGGPGSSSGPRPTDEVAEEGEEGQRMLNQERLV